MSNFTPTTEQVRDGYRYDTEDEYRDPIGAPQRSAEAGRAFDRWLAAHDAELLDHLEAQQTDAPIRRGLEDAAAGRTEYLGRFADDEPEPDYGPRPAGCCGTCPPVLGGGYDCTCADNPRCEANHTDRIDRNGDRWVWCDDCDGLRMDGHEAHESGFGRPAVELDELCGPLTFASRPADVRLTEARQLLLTLGEHGQWRTSRGWIASPEDIVRWTLAPAEWNEGVQ